MNTSTNRNQEQLALWQPRGQKRPTTNQPSRPAKRQRSHDQPPRLVAPLRVVPLREQRPPRFERSRQQADQIGAVVRTRVTRTGLSDIRGHRVAFLMGYTYVGNGTDGTANLVYLETASQTYLIKGFVAGSSSGQAPILASDVDLGQSYIADVEKHFARKVIKRMWIHVDSLQPSTSNNMVAIIGVSRGAGGAAYSLPIALANAAVTANSFNNVSSMSKSLVVDSWESRSLEITDMIAGGSGPRQNEFQIGTSPAGGIYEAGSGTPAQPALLQGIAPACLAVAGNSSTAALEATLVHQIVVEQEVDYLDYCGGMVSIGPEA